jgi:hypothetical protein
MCNEVLGTGITKTHTPRETLLDKMFYVEYVYGDTVALQNWMLEFQSWLVTILQPTPVRENMYQERNAT